MRKIEMPIAYEANTGKWLNLCGLTYDDKENIVEVEVWDGDGVTTYKHGEFELDENKVAPLYHKNDELKNLQQGLKSFIDKCENLKNFNMNQLLQLYGNISVLINKSMEKYSIEIAYPAQKLQSLIERKLERRCKNGSI